MDFDGFFAERVRFCSRLVSSPVSFIIPVVTIGRIARATEGGSLSETDCGDFSLCNHELQLGNEQHRSIRRVGAQNVNSAQCMYLNILQVDKRHCYSYLKNG